MTNAYILHRSRINTKVLYTATATHYEYYPLAKGNIAPSFSLKSQEQLQSNTSGNLHKENLILLEDLLQEQQPLVAIFYTAGKHKTENIRFFERLHQKITAKGGKLLVITNVEDAAHGNSTTLFDIFKDRHNNVAKAFGLYNPQNPLWNWVPGIEESETFLPAFYVIAPDKQIVYHHIDYNFSMFNDPDLLQNAFVQRLLDSVEQTANAYYPVAYKLVS